MLVFSTIAKVEDKKFEALKSGGKIWNASTSSSELVFVQEICDTSFGKLLL
jgi:hypothetical protein